MEVRFHAIIAHRASSFEVKGEGGPVLVAIGHLKWFAFTDFAILLFWIHPGLV